MRSLSICCCLLAAPALAQPAPPKPPGAAAPAGKPAAEGPAAGGHGHGHHGHHGAMNAAEVHALHQDMDGYIAAMESKDRDAWQRPDALLDAIGVGKGQRVVEIGPGPGYFTRRIGRRVLPGGWVYAVDIEPRMLQALQTRLVTDGLRDVTTILGTPEDPMLPDGVADLILIVDTYHHIGAQPADRPRYLARLARALRPGGRIVIVDFHKRPLPMGPPPEMKLTPEEVSADAAKAGLRPLPSPPPELLPHQYVLAFAPVQK